MELEDGNLYINNRESIMWIDLELKILILCGRVA